MNNEKDMYPPVVKSINGETGVCFCCKREKEGSYIKKDSRNLDNEVFVCHECNHLRPSLQGEADSLRFGEKDELF